MDKDELGFYEKMNVPIPKVCPDCRFKMRALWRNETTLYSGRNCDLCGKGIVTMYNPKSPYKVYCYNCFYSEKWDPKDYAQDYDYSRPFLNQFREFLIKVPKIATYLSFGDGENVNSEYTNMASGCKNCYLVFNTSPAEELLYSRGIKNGRDSSDLYFGVNIERCYNSINIQESYGVTNAQNVVNCVDSHFLLNTRGLVNCFGCVNLSNKSYHFLNQELNKDEYEKKVGEILGSYKKTEEFKKVFHDFCLQFPVRENNNIKTTNSIGDYIFESKNIYDSFEVAGSEDGRYLFSSKMIKDSLGTTGYGTKAERLLECVATGYSSNIIGSYGIENSHDVMYSFYIHHCHDCIACDALKSDEYSIFNKQYSKDEYIKLKDKIIEELRSLDLYGLIIPPELAPFAYNETIAQDNFPLAKDEVLALGFRWEDDIQKTEGRGTIKREDLPDSIKDTNENITKEILTCISCSRNYKITNQEFIFYKKMNIPIPRKCFYCRHKYRVEKRGPYKFWERNCAQCNKVIFTNYEKTRPEIVYCEKCFQQEVY